MPDGRLRLVDAEQREEHHRVREELAGGEGDDVDVGTGAQSIDARHHHAEEHSDDERPERTGEERELARLRLGSVAVHAQRPRSAPGPPPGTRCAGTPRLTTMSRAIFGSVSG